jgi:hypothetical protein
MRQHLFLLSLCRRSYDPDLVVSVHPLMQHINCHVLRERAKRLGRARPTPFATVVTDFTTCHNTWFCKVWGVADALATGYWLKLM